MFHPFGFIQMDPYIICHKLFQPPAETQLATFQEFPPALTTTVSACFTETNFSSQDPHERRGSASLQVKDRSMDILNQKYAASLSG